MTDEARLCGGERSRRGRAAALAAVLLLGGCSSLGPPPMEPLTAATLDAAERRWAANGPDSYHLVVRVRPPRFKPAVYDLVVSHGEVVALERDGTPVRPEHLERYDFSVEGIFALLREDLHLTEVRPGDGDVPPIDLRALFEPATGRPVRYRRTVGTARRRVLLVEVLRYEPHATVKAAGKDATRGDGTA